MKKNKMTMQDAIQRVLKAVEYYEWYMTLVTKNKMKKIKTMFGRVTINL